MKLYHGTRSGLSSQILELGLLPRVLTESDNKWDECPSRPDAVYLTSVYAPYFAATACGSREDSDDKWLIVEVETEKMCGLMCPDEDFLEQSQRSSGSRPHGATMEQMTAFWRENCHRYSGAWKDSLNGLGTCSVISDVGVPPEAITGVFLFDNEAKENREIVWACCDPTITLMNYQICNDKYRGLTQQVIERAERIGGTES